MTEGVIDQDLSLRDGAQIYFARNGGALDDTTKALATDPSSDLTSLDPAEIANLTGINPGDVIVVSGRGGVITDQIDAPASGTAEKSLRIIGEKDVPPTITVTGNNRALRINAKNYVDIGFFPNCSNTDGAFGAVVYVFGPSVGCRLESINVTRNRNVGGTSSRDCFAVLSDGAQTAHVVGRNLSAADFKDGAQGNNQGFLAKDGSTLDVYGWACTNGNIAASSNGTDARLRLYDGLADDMAVKISDALSGGETDVFRSSLRSTGGKPGVDDDSITRFTDCYIEMSDSGNRNFNGLLEFDGCELIMSGGRFQTNNAAAIWRFKNGIFRPGDGDFWNVIQQNGGAIQVEDSLIDCADVPAADSGVFQIDGDASDNTHYFRRLAVKDFNTVGLFLQVNNSGANPKVDLFKVTAWNQVAGGTLLDDNRSDGSVMVTQCGFVNCTPVSGSPAMRRNGFFNAAASGDLPVIGDPSLTDPENDDFTYGPNSPWNQRGINNNDPDIGISRKFSR
ncbi:MAG: hypothetical protein QNJ62_05105 [Methyloceanibacter sp.]|nr:hypothetical protein [Methyloceanibacter sp.]